jgi:hypothetical protein
VAFFLCGLLLVGLPACLYLFASAKRDLWAAEKRTARRIEGLEAEIQALREKVEEPPAPAPPARAGFNLTTRSQALRLSRRGDRPDQIAAALGIPEREVELLLKVDRAVETSPPNVAHA